MLKDIGGIRLQGANFMTATDLKLFEANGIHRACLIYGKNGSGKSTISRAFNKIKGIDETTIATAGLIDFSNNEIPITDIERKQIFVFNEDYVDANVRLREEGLDTIVVLGEQKELEDQINEIKQKQNDVQKKFNRQKEVCDQYNDAMNIESPEYYKKNMILSLKGDGNWAYRDSQIKGNRQASAVRDNTYEQFVGRQPQKNRDKLVIEFKENFIEYEEAQNGSKRINLPVKTRYQIIFNEIDFLQTLAKKIEEPNLTDRDKFLLDIVAQKGQGYLQGVKGYFETEKHDICPYCMQSVSDEYKEELYLNIEKILSKTSKEHQLELDKYYRNEIVIDFEPYRDLDEVLIKKCQESLREYNSVIKLINEKISVKKENVYSPIIIDAFNVAIKLEELNSVLVELEKTRIDFNKSATDISSKKDKLNEINNDIAYYDIKDNYANYLKQLLLREQENTKLKELHTLLEGYNNEVKELEIKKKNIRIAMKSINDGLRYIFFSDNRLSVEYKDDKYYLFSRGNSVTPQKISVGERNAIAMCYFFADIMNNKEEIEIYNKEYLIVIDDPVSSFDIENRVGILSYLKHQLQRFICGNIATKAIMLTHDIQTFYDIKKLTEEIISMSKEVLRSQQKPIFSIYELSCQNICQFKFNDRNEYTSLMENIFDYAQGLAIDYELVVGNSMRRVLEAFSTFIYKKGIDGVSLDPAVMGNIASPYKSYFENLMYRLVLHGGSHSEENVKALRSMDFFDYISSSEKRRTAKDVLCFIYLLNKTHVLKHLSSKGNVEHTIESWLRNIGEMTVENIS